MEAESLLIALKEEDRCKAYHCMVMSSFSSEICRRLYKKQACMILLSYSIEGGGQKHEGARHITGNVLILLRN